MGERKIWFITRPVRDPAFHKDALITLKEATNNFSFKWTGNRKIHKKYEEVLAQKGLKRDFISNDGSGGRTWAALLRTFSYCYLNEEGFLILTKVGKNIIEDAETKDPSKKGVSIYDNVKKQILTLQIPNAYFLDSSFRPGYGDGFAIRPVRFLIKLCLQEKLFYYVTIEEVTFFAMTTKRDDELEKVTNRIIEYRKSPMDKKREIRNEIAEIFDHRERSDKGARDFDEAHKDVAHTFMLIAKFTGLVDYIDKMLKINPDFKNSVKSEIEMYDRRYPFNRKYLISLQRMAESNGLDLDSYKANNYGDIKPASNRTKSLKKAEQLLSRYSQPTTLSFEERFNILVREFPSAEAERLASEFQNSLTLNTLSDEFIESYLNESDNRAFEDKTGQILKQIGFDVVMRPKPLNGENTEIEILVKYGTNKFGILDAKNYRDKFTLSSNLATYMASEYIRNYYNYDNREITFFGYIAANDIGGDKKLEKVSKLSKKYTNDRELKGIMINARTLLSFLDYCIENDIAIPERINLFLKAINNTSYTSFDILISRISN